MFDPSLLAHVEDAGLNASAPTQQRWVDGWLVRFSPGKAKRARCINAVAPGRLGVEEKIALCEPLYAQGSLPLYVRVTPFSHPRDLDIRLGRMGMDREDDTRVMVCSAPGTLPAARFAPGHRIERLGHRRFAELVGRLRGSPQAHVRAHAQRLATSPVPYAGFALVDSHGAMVSCGQFALEGCMVGLYDVYTDEAHRARGYARALCRYLLEVASARGATVSYLQVEAANAPARRVYQQLGFRDAYAYHYRRPGHAEGAAGGPGTP